MQSQNYELENGIVKDTLWVDDNKTESFSCYLPKKFEPGVPSPLVVIFEPMARGSLGIEPFRLAAETYGYILVCSNNSRNGPYERNYAITNNLFSKVLSMFSIDEKRIYTAGFSGGGRLASNLAIQSDKIQGVVSCGAAFNLKSRGLPTTQYFSYACIMGNEDMNYTELQFTTSYLNNTQTSFEFFTYDMNHKWPNQDQILIAFDWLQMEAHKKQLLAKNDEEIKSIYSKFYRQMLIYEKQKQFIPAAQSYRRILKNFNRYYDLDSIEEKYKALNENKNYQNERKKNQDLIKTEVLLTDELWYQFEKDLSNENYSISWWEKKIGHLKKKQDSKDQMEQKMYNRLLYKIFARAIETAKYEQSVSSIAQKMLCYDICILVYPSYYPAYFKQIGYTHALGQEDKLFEYLEKLMENGYDKKNLNLDKNIIDSIKNTDRYHQLMKEYN